MGLLILSFVFILAIFGTAFLGVFIYKLDQTPEMTPRMRLINRALVVVAGVILTGGLAVSSIADRPLADWGQFVSLAVLAIMMLFLAAQGFGIGFQQMEEDGIGFLRFFQIGSAIVFCMAFVPAFVAFITYSTKL
jgi:hypothetical protein